MANPSEIKMALQDAQTALGSGNPARAIALYERIAEMAAKAGARELQAEAEIGWAEALRQTGASRDEIFPHIARAAELGEGTDSEGMAFMLIADIFKASRELERAVEGYRQGALRFERVNNPMGEALCRDDLGLCLHELGRYDEAFAERKHAAGLYAMAEEFPSAARLAFQIGNAALRLNRVDEARDALTKAAELFGLLGEKQEEARCRQLLFIPPIGDMSQLARLNQLLAEHAAEVGDARTEANVRMMQAEFLRGDDE